MDLIIRSKRIDAPIMTILTTLKSELHNGLLKDIERENQDNIPITCPSHKGGRENKPSCYVYCRRDNDKVEYGRVHCFTCGFHGDIFDVYREFEKCDFKTAYKALGGKYETPKYKATHSLKISAYERERAEQKAKEEAEHKFFLRLTMAMEMCRRADEACEIFSDNWTYLVNQRDWLNYCYELKYIEGKEINEVDVDRVSREVRRRFFAV